MSRKRVGPCGADGRLLIDRWLLIGRLTGRLFSSRDGARVSTFFSFLVLAPKKKTDVLMLIADP